MSCNVGIESIGTTVQYHLENFGRCVSYAPPQGVTSEAWNAYNATVCGFAGACSKVNTVGSSFLSCVKNTFCRYATDAVKTVGQVVYETNKERLYYSYLAPAAGLTVASTVASFALDKYASESKLARAFSIGSKCITAVSFFLAVSFLGQIKS
jgi:hypothetical protein